MKTIRITFGDDLRSGYGQVLFVFFLAAVSLYSYRWLLQLTALHNQHYEQLAVLLKAKPSFVGADPGRIPARGDYGAYYRNTDAWSLCFSLQVIDKHGDYRCQKYENSSQ